MWPLRTCAGTLLSLPPSAWMFRRMTPSSSAIALGSPRRPAYERSRIGLLCGGYAQEELERAGCGTASTTIPPILLAHIEELGIQNRVTL